MQKEGRRKGKKMKEGELFFFLSLCFFLFFFPKRQRPVWAGRAGVRCLFLRHNRGPASPTAKKTYLLPWGCSRPPGLAQSMCAGLLFNCFDSDRNSVCCLCCCCCCCCVSMCMCVSVTDFSFLE
jgi:hypothetical protein